MITYHHQCVGCQRKWIASTVEGVCPYCNGIQINWEKTFKVGDEISVTSFPDCVFCTFLETGTREEQKVYEDGVTYAFLDDFPIEEGHTVILLKAHRKDITSLTIDEARWMGETAWRIDKALREATGSEAIYFAAVGESVPHVHYHLVPRYKGQQIGFVHFSGRRRRLTEGTARYLALRIREALETMKTI